MWERSLSYKMSKHDCFHACPCPQLHLGEDHPKPWVWMPDRGPSLVTLEAEEHCNTTLLLWSTKDITTKPRWRVLCKDKVTLALCWLLLADMPRAARTCVMLMHLRNVLLCPHRFWCKLVKFCISFNRGRVRHHDEVANAPGRLLLLLLRMYVNGNGWEIKDQLRLSLNLKKNSWNATNMYLSWYVFPASTLLAQHTVLHRRFSGRWCCVLLRSPEILLCLDFCLPLHLNTPETSHHPQSPGPLPSRARINGIYFIGYSYFWSYVQRIYLNSSKASVI